VEWVKRHAEDILQASGAAAIDEELADSCGDAVPERVRVTQELFGTD
jgi:hypothetical protein